MKYKGGFPSFDIEKPMMIPWASDYLMRLQESGDYLAEYKLNEARSFLVTDTKGRASLYSRHSKLLALTPDAQDELNSIKLPPCTIFDGGHYKHSKISTQSRIWLFDILIYRGNKVREPWVKRRELLEKTIPPDLKHLWYSPLITNFLEVFSDLIRKRTPLFDPIFERSRVDREKILPEIEGLVIKRKSGLLSFPTRVKETPNFYKLRLMDLPKNYKSWVKPVAMKE